MFDKFLLQVVRNAEEIVSFKPEVGRGKVFWVCFKNRFGKCSTFLKKKISDWVQKVYRQFESYQWVQFDTVETPEGKRYTTTQDSCTCPDFKHNVSKEKTWRTFCKHQLMQRVRLVTNQKQRLESYRFQKQQLTEKLDELKEDTFFYERGKHYGLSYRLDTVRLGDAQFSISVGSSRIGTITVDSFSAVSKATHNNKRLIGTLGEIRQRILGKDFDSSLDALNYLLKGIVLLTIDEQQAKNSLFWEEPNNDYHQTFYSDSEREADLNDTEYPMPEYSEQEEIEESKSKKWLSLSDLLPF